MNTDGENEEETTEPEVPEWHKQIVLERLKNYENGTERALCWEEVKKELNGE